MSARSALPNRAAYEFEWDVAAEGYEWATTGDGGRVLAWEVPAGDWVAKTYRPLNRRTLHRIFARTQPTEEGILRFANRYGFLTDGETYFGDGPGGKVGFWKAEPFELWRDEIGRMAAYLELWDLAITDRGSELARRHVIWDGRDRVRVSVDFDHEKEPPRWYGPSNPAFKRWEYPKTVGPALYHVHHRINEMMRGKVSPVILPFRDGDLVFVPKDLLSALWLLFALEISGKPRPARICPSCGRHFVPLHGKSRYCSQACRQAAYEARQRAAA